MDLPAGTREQAGLDRRAKLAIAACVVLPVLIGVVVTAGTFRSDPPAPPPVTGHWVYVSSLGAAVHVDGNSKKVDASVPVGAASANSLVVQDQHANYLVDSDKTIVFTKTGVTGHEPSAGVADPPVPMQAAGKSYLVYQSARVIVPVGSGQQVQADGPLGVPVMTPTGELWVNRTDTGDICVLEKSLLCNDKGNLPGALTLVDGQPYYLDVKASTLRSLAAKSRPEKLGVPLPDNAIIGSAAVAGRVPVIDPAAKQLLLIARGGDVIKVPLDPGSYESPYVAGDAVAVVDRDTGKITSYDGAGHVHTSMMLGSDAHMTQGDDGRVYMDSMDGLSSIVMDADGTLTQVQTSDQAPPVYHQAAPTTTAPLPPADIAPTTTETVPDTPDTVTVQVTPTTTGGGAGGAGGGAGGGGGAAGAGGSSSTKPKGPTSTKPFPGAPGPTVDVLGVTPSGGGKATVHVSVQGSGAAFCHIFFNSVERAAAQCTGKTDITATGIPLHQVYDVHVIGVNDQGAGVPGRRVQVAM